jgi:diacylglycerol O-acyltransferase / wax synthase
MDLMPLSDAVFLHTESREHPMHVGILQLFKAPEDAGPDFAREIYAALVTNQDFQPMFRKRPRTFLGGITNLGWCYDDEIDMDYHVQRWALPRPGRFHELLELTSRLHSSPLDRYRPLWEVHVVEGLAGGRFAIYVKIHHALTDGVAASMLMQRTLSTDSRELEVRALWNQPPRPHHLGSPSQFRSLMRMARSVVALGPSTVSLVRAALIEHQMTLPFAAPHTMLNVKVGGARRCVVQSWSLDRIRPIKQATGATVNDVVLAMCAGALRYYLADQDALPEAPLVALVPVSLRSPDGHDSGGTKVGTVFCNLATDTDDPARRLQKISESMRRNKRAFSELSPLQAQALWALNIAPLSAAAVPGFISSAPPSFNVIVSNVPGPAEPMYCRGARLEGCYPLSLAHDGQALSITLFNYAGNLDFGLVGCRRSVPHLERLLVHMESSLKDLERAVGA